MAAVVMHPERNPVRIDIDTMALGGPEILRCKQFIVHDGVGFKVVQGHIVEFLVPSLMDTTSQVWRRIEDVVNPTLLQND